MGRIARLAALLAALAAARAAADGGVVRVREQAGDVTVTVFTAPTPLRVGPIDVSVLVQDGRGEVVGDAAVAVALRAARDGTAVAGAATRAQATNKLLYAAPLTLPAAGTWRVEVRVTRPGSAPAAVGFAVEAAPPLPPWRAYWPYFALPAVAIAVYALHQWLVLGRGGRG